MAISCHILHSNFKSRCERMIARKMNFCTQFFAMGLDISFILIKLLQFTADFRKSCILKQSASANKFPVFTAKNFGPQNVAVILEPVDNIVVRLKFSSSPVQDTWSQGSDMAIADILLAIISTLVFIWDFLTWPIYQGIYKPWEKRKNFHKLRSRKVKFVFYLLFSCHFNCQHCYLRIFFQSQTNAKET